MDERNRKECSNARGRKRGLSEVFLQLKFLLSFYAIISHYVKTQLLFHSF